MAPGSADRFVYPADFICEAIDQTRGWFYSLLAVNTLVRGTTPYRNVLCLGHIVDADGRKMSKSVGNVIDPWEILGTRGADPLRWWMFSQGSPWTPTRVSFEVIDVVHAGHPAHAVEHLVLLHHLRLAERVRPGRPGHPRTRATGRCSTGGCGPGSHATVAAVTEALDGYEPFPAATAIAELRRRHSPTGTSAAAAAASGAPTPSADPADSLGAQATLHEALVTMALLMAPMCPFLADRMWRDLTGRRRGRLGPSGRLAAGRARGPSTPTSRRGWPWPAACPPSVGRPGPRPG